MTAPTFLHALRIDKVARSLLAHGFLGAPISNFLQRFSGSCCLNLQSLHSRRSVIFFVVLAFLWKTGFDWPP